MTKLAPLGSPPRFELRRVERVTFRVDFEFDGQEYDGREDGFAPSRRVAKRTFFSEVAAYRWLARRLIFVRRDEWCGREKRYPNPEDGECQCRYHSERTFRRLEIRLARWLRWRDRRRAAA